MKQPNSISSYDSDDGFIDTYSENFHEEDDALLPRSHAKKLSKVFNRQEEDESTIKFKIGRKKSLKVSTISYSYTYYHIYYTEDKP